MPPPPRRHEAGGIVIKGAVTAVEHHSGAVKQIAGAVRASRSATAVIAAAETMTHADDLGNFLGLQEVAASTMNLSTPTASEWRRRHRRGELHSRGGRPRQVRHIPSPRAAETAMQALSSGCAPTG